MIINILILLLLLLLVNWLTNSQFYTELTSELIGGESSAKESVRFQEVLSVFPTTMKTLWVSKFINKALLLLWN